MAAVAAHGEKGAFKVYQEIYQDTSSGDFGIQVVDGPLFRCHTYIISKCGGFIQKVRRFGRSLQREVKQGTVPPVKDYFKAKGYTRLLQDLASIQFSQPMKQSAMQSLASKMVQQEDPLAPGYTTAHFIGGTTGAVRRSDPYMLAERYEVDCDCELLAELLRYIYQGVMSFFDTLPKTDKEKEVLTHKMLKICMDAEKFSLDSLYEQLLAWFGTKCFSMLGDSNFADAFYSLEHAVARCTEDHSRQALVATVTGDMLASREQFHAVTRDPRWRSLPIDFVEHTLVYDGMPISSESEVLNLIERWNANADKSSQEIIRLLRCFRVDEENKPVIQAWMRSQGWLSMNGVVPDLPQLKGVREIVNGSASRGKKPRKNLAGTQLIQAQNSQEKDSRISEEDEATFVHYKGASVAGTGHTFELGSQQRLVQMDAIHSAGVQRLRVVLCSPRRQLWDPEHEVFVGCSYGEGRYFGYLCSATAFSGIFSVRALASAAPAPNAPVHLTGSGNKVEFDMTLEVQLHRVNLVVMCKLGVVFANQTVAEELFQISYDTLAGGGPGLRYQVVATGLGHETVDVSLGWVSTRMASEEKEAIVGPLDFQPGD